MYLLPTLVLSTQCWSSKIGVSLTGLWVSFKISCESWLSAPGFWTCTSLGFTDSNIESEDSSCSASISLMSFKICVRGSASVVGSGPQSCTWRVDVPPSCSSLATLSSIIHLVLVVPAKIGNSVVQNHMWNVGPPLSESWDPKTHPQQNTNTGLVLILNTMKKYTKICSKLFKNWAVNVPYCNVWV